MSDGTIVCETQPGWMETPLVSPDARHLAVGGPDGRVRLLRVENVVSGATPEAGVFS